MEEGLLKTGIAERMAAAKRDRLDHEVHTDHAVTVHALYLSICIGHGVSSLLSQVLYQLLLSHGLWPGGWRSLSLWLESLNDIFGDLLLHLVNSFLLSFREIGDGISLSGVDLLFLLLGLVKQGSFLSLVGSLHITDN